jgi:hypothetical protein
MKRRQLLKASLVGSVLVGVSGAAVWFSIESNQEPLTIEAALARLNQLSAVTISSEGEWSVFQVFNHCAQSVEFSMTGYPKHKSDLFKRTAGSLAFSAFSSKGKMTHGLSESIPGAPELETSGKIDLAIERFRQSMIDFERYQGELAPHFAYGELSKKQYEKAHVMHFYNHLKELSS